MRPLLALVMILKDEASNIRGVLESVKPFVDRWEILDTGSTDETPAIVREVMTGIPGALTSEGFIDFASSRNRVLDLHAAQPERAEFVLMLSGDEYLQGGTHLREYLESHRDSQVDCHRVRLFLDDSRLDSPRVLRAGSAWRYEGEVHEFPANRVDPEAPVERVREVFIEHVASDPEGRLQNIWDHHVPLLKAKLEENPNDERALVFLAASYESLLPFMGPGERISYAMEAMGLYIRRLALPVATEAERNYLRLRYLDDARLTGVYSPDEVLSRAVELHEADVQHPETALLVVYAAVAARMPTVRVYELAARAARIAAAAEDLDSSSPLSLSCEWKAHHAATSAARILAAKFPGAGPDDSASTYEELVHRHIEAGLAAGGSFDLFHRSNAEAPATAAETPPPPPEAQT